MRSGSGWKPALFIYEGEALGTSEIFMLILRLCGCVDCIYAPRIEPCFHLYWIFLTQTSLEDAAEKIRFIDEGHGNHHGELTESVFAGCRGVDCIYTPRIESFLYVPWILKP